MLLKEFDFEFAMDPKDVGMQTGATIHTMNGLNMYPRKSENSIPDADGWWEKEHLKRGLTANGRPASSNLSP